MSCLSDNVLVSASTTTTKKTEGYHFISFLFLEYNRVKHPSDIKKMRKLFNAFRLPDISLENNAFLNVPTRAYIYEK